MKQSQKFLVLLVIILLMACRDDKRTPTDNPSPYGTTPSEIDRSYNDEREGRNNNNGNDRDMNDMDMNGRGNNTSNLGTNQANASDGTINSNFDYNQPRTQGMYRSLNLTDAQIKRYESDYRNFLG